MRFRNRSEAGKILGRILERYRHRPDALVLGLPRGGVPVAFEVARYLNAPMDVFIVRKLGVPGHEELAMGAIAMGGIRILNTAIIQELNISSEAIESVILSETEELERREHLYRGDASELSISGRTVIIVDDGLATGSTMRAAVAAIYRKDPLRIVVAVPAGAAETIAELGSVADEVRCAVIPEPFYAVGQCYEDFEQTTDEEVIALLRKSCDPGA